MTLRAAPILRITAIAWLALGAAIALGADVTAQHHGAYQRLNFALGPETRFTTSANGNTLVLHFDKTVAISPAQVQGLLKGYATAAHLSADGKTLTLSMTKAYRTRQFVSGAGVGIDIIGQPDNDAPPTAIVDDESTKEVDEALTTAKPEPAPAEAAPKKVGTIPTAPAAKDAQKPPFAHADPVKPPSKKGTPAPIPKVTVADATPPTQQILTTKPATPPAPEKPAPAPVAKPAEIAATPPAPAPVPAKVEASVAKPEPVMAKPVEKPAEVPAPAKAEPTKAEAKAPVSASGPFLVSAHSKAGTTTVNFPFRARTAVAVYERGRDIWLVFSQPEAVNIGLLRTVLPQAVVNVTQYGNAGTLLKLSTDGSIHASAHPIKDSYGWDISLGSAGESPPLDIPVSIDSTDSSSRLLLGAFDNSEPLTFYDPEVGDRVIVIPTFEPGRGVARARHFPQVDVLASNQGIAVASPLDDLRATSSRLGIAIESANGLAVSKNLFVQDVKAGLASGPATGILLPYDQWFVPPDKFHDAKLERLATLATATKASRPDALLNLATLYLGQGMGTEALGYLQLIQAESPDFYKARKLALLITAANVLENQLPDAAEAVAAPELAEVKEADLWKEYLALFGAKPNAVQQAVQTASPADTQAAPKANPYVASDDAEDAGGKTIVAPPTATVAPAQKPLMQYLKYDKPYIRYYPPRIRQKLAVGAADAYVDNGLEDKALATFDSLNKDGILGPVTHHAEYVLGLVAIKNKKNKETEEIFGRLAAQPDDPEMAARARFSEAMLQLNTNAKTPQETIDTLESIRTSWRGDALEKKILLTLVQLGKDTKQYDISLRALKTYVDSFPGDSDYLTLSGQMEDLFEQLYLNGLADQMPPLKSLSLFYEFRDLTPIGDKGDSIIQKLADRLAAFDLIDRASQLLENQIAFRISGQLRSQVGARLALLYLLNHQPEEALRVLEVTNYGQNPAELQRQRLELTAQALEQTKRYEDALNVLYNDNTLPGELLKVDILWSAQDWPNMVNRAEEILSKRPDLTAKLTPTETDVLLKLALGYSFEGDYNQLRYLRDYYTALLGDSAYKQIFDYITNDTAPLDREDTTMLTEQISHTQSFLDTFKAKIAAGKLSEAIK